MQACCNLGCRDLSGPPIISPPQVLAHLASGNCTRALPAAQEWAQRMLTKHPYDFRDPFWYSSNA